LYNIFKYNGNLDRDLDWLNIVAKRHKYWVGIVRSLIGDFYAEDIVQEAYIALTKYSDPDKIIKDGKVSEGYMFFTLRSLAYQFYNKKKKVSIISIDIDESFLQLPDKDNIEENEAFHKICLLVDDVAKDWHWYDKKIWRLYSQTDMSIRKLATETKISWVSIFNTLKNLKLDIKNKIEENYEDYKFGDWERIDTDR
jgi:hypothetical protein